MSLSIHSQGWLTIAHDISDTAEWQKRYCILARDERKLYFFADQETAMIKSPFSPVRSTLAPDNIDGCVVSTSRRGTLTLGVGESSPFQRNSRTSRSFRDRVRSFKSKKSPQRNETLSTTSGSVLHGLKQNLSRSKSLGKSEGDLILPRMRGGRSLDNLHRVSSAETEGHLTLGEPGTYIDLATKGTLSIQMVHPSVSPRHSCFCVITDYDRLYASCGSAEELHKWITNLNECHRPNRDHLCRLSTQICVWVVEARNLQTKKRYFCEVYLNNILYCQTCCKTMQDLLFWGEPFFFEELPVIGSVQIKLLRETNKKRENGLETIGQIDIPTIMLTSGQVTEKWYPVNLLQPPKVQQNQKDAPAIRIKVLYQVVSILPLKCYISLQKYIESNFAVLCEVLEPKISAKTKDEIAQALIRILEHGGKSREFLCDIVMAEVQQVDNVNLIFRGNTFATKAVDTYMKMVGDSYLRQTLKPFIHDLLESSEDCEVDPAKLLPPASLLANQAVLKRVVEKVWIDILSSWNRFPSDLRDALCGIRQRFGPEREDACFKLITGSIFLRFFCPAILSPSLFQLCQEYPDEKSCRKLTLVAKVIQNLANFARFGVKEEYMCFMNEFVEKEIHNMKQFIHRISSPVPESHPVVEWGPFHIDIGRELSITHSILLSLLPTLKDVALARISELPGILDNITQIEQEANEDPLSSTFEALRLMNNTISKFTSAPLSNSSSEYATPAQSTSTSPSHDQRPMSQAIMGAGIKVSPTHTRQISAPIEWTYSSPTLSPIHNSVHKSLLGHRATSSMPQQQIHQLQESINSINSPSPSHSYSNNSQKENTLTSSQLEIPEIITEDDHLTMRRNSDSIIERFSISPTNRLESAMSHKFDQTIYFADLQAENSDLIQERDKLKSELLELHDRFQTIEKENFKLKSELITSEDLKKKSEANYRSLCENRGKVLRGLNTQTEIAKAQFQRDFEALKKQLETKDEIIQMQERKLKTLMDANCMLRNGLEQVQGPAFGGMETESEDDESLQNSIANGHNKHTTTTVQADLAKFIKQLDL